MSQVHYEVFVRKPGAPGWTLELATEDRTRAMEVADDLVATGKAAAARVSKETLDEETREFKSVVLVTKGDIGKADKKKADKDATPLCVSPQDLYTIHARDVIGRLLEGWLARERVTPFELLHRPDLLEKLDASGMDLQHAIQKIAIPEAQERGTSVHEIIRHFQALIQKSIDRVLKDEKKSVFPDLEREGFGDACQRLTGEGEPGYLLGGAIARSIGKANAWSDKVNRLLDLADAAPLAPGPRALAFQVLETPLAEILGSRSGMAALLGSDLDLGGSVCAMTRLCAADTVDALAAIEPRVERNMPALNGAAARLANWFEGDKFANVRSALAARVLHELSNPRRLRPGDCEGEIELLRALAMCLTAAAGKAMPIEAVQAAFIERSKMLTRSDFVEDYIGDKRTPIGEIEALIWLADNVTGAANKRAASRWIASHLTALKFERDLRAAPDMPTAKLAALAAIQKSVARVGFVPEELGPIQTKIGEIGGLIEADAKFLAVLSKAALPTTRRLQTLLRMATGESAPIGPVSERAKIEVMKLTKSPEVRMELAKSPEQLETMRSMLQSAGLAA